MICIILAAGYATRLYPLTENFPISLLQIKGKTILDWLIDNLELTGQISRYIVVSNNRYYNHFVEWSKDKSYAIEVLDDGSVSNETRLGAVRDIEFVVETKNIDQDILVIAGDNLLDFSFFTFINYCKEKKTSCIMRYYEKDKKRLRSCGVVKVDDKDKILSMVEKPREPESNYCCPPFYYYTKKDVKKIKRAIDNGCNTDAPGSLAVWMSGHSTMHAMLMPGNRYDIGTYEDYLGIEDKYKGHIDE